MARTVTSPIEVSHGPPGAGSEIVSDYQDRGWSRTAGSIATLHEQGRRGPINDVGNDESEPILTQDGQIAYYRCRCSTRTGLAAGEELQVFLDVLASGEGDFEVTVTSSLDSTTWVYPGGSIDGRVDAGTLQVPDGATYFDLEVEITELSGMDDSDVISVVAYWVRDRAELDAVAEGDDAYDSGAVPPDVARYAAQLALSTERVQDLHTTARVILTRGDQVVALASPNATLNSSSEVPHFVAPVPPLPLVLDPSRIARAWLHVWIRAGGESTDDVSIDVLGDGWTAYPVEVSSGASAWYGPIEIPATALPSALLCRVTIAAGVEVETVCGWWEDVEYEGEELE